MEKIEEKKEEELLEKKSKKKEFIMQEMPAEEMEKYLENI